MFRWMGRTFARFVGLLITLLGLWIIGNNTFLAIVEERTYDPE